MPAATAAVMAAMPERLSPGEFRRMLGECRSALEVERLQLNFWVHVSATLEELVELRRAWEARYEELLDPVPSGRGEPAIVTSPEFARSPAPGPDLLGTLKVLSETEQDLITSNL